MNQDNLIHKLYRRIKSTGLPKTYHYVCKVGSEKATSYLSNLRRIWHFKITLPYHIAVNRKRYLPQRKETFAIVREKTLAYIEANRIPELGIGAYSFKVGGPSLLYASCYALLTLDLYGALSDLSDDKRRQWITYLQSHQSVDGLFRDPLLDIPLASECDWWGWRHLTLHALMALSCLGGKAEKKFTILDPFKKRDYMVDWLLSRNWEIDPASVSNEIQNVAVLLQYARDFQGESWCHDILLHMYDWFDSHQDAETGLWGERCDSPILLSSGVQTGYHLWSLYLYDQRPINYMDKIIDSCLATQNQLGGYGVPLNSSACEDIDSIDPLVRFYYLTDYRRDDIRKSLEKALIWVMVNRNSDGGWVFRRYESFFYGHELMCTAIDESSMFPTWFRTLSLAYLSKVLSDQSSDDIKWHFSNSPGLQFWNNYEQKRNVIEPIG